MIRLKSAAALAVLMFSALSAIAEYPVKPVTLVIGFAEGDGGDALGRALAQKLEADIGANVIVENIGGSGGAVAAANLAGREPDGYTIGMVLSFANSFMPLTGKVDYTADSFDYLGTISHAGSAFLARADHGYTDFAGLMAKAKDDGYLTYGSLTPIDRMIMQSIAKKEGFELDIIPAKGGGALRAALIAGDTEAVLGGASGLKLAADNDTISVLATFNQQRLESEPDVPTLLELGYDGLSSDTYFLIYGPKGMPDEALAKLSASVQKIAASDEIAELVRRLGSRPSALSGPEARDLVAEQVEFYRNLIEATR